MTTKRTSIVEHWYDERAYEEFCRWMLKWDLVHSDVLRMLVRQAEGMPPKGWEKKGRPSKKQAASCVE
ncbi:MAG: hypothetical protein JRJ29_00410 [Deltaproteobacteria bacterium]|nr:hypothetical protein [Deltaproteobacteria bacterium]MBW2081629.1 hypothetical protein [Deltaproteobacteria bacterium]